MGVAVAAIVIAVAIACFRAAQKRRFEAAALPLVQQASERVRTHAAEIAHVNAGFAGGSEIARRRLPMPLASYPEALVRPTASRSTRRRAVPRDGGRKWSWVRRRMRPCR